jgi:GNAT superfamily N-acetyltransferase
MSDLNIRDASGADLGAICRLISQLGYPEPEDTIAARIAILAEAGGRLLLATRGEAIVGLAALDRTRHLHRPPDGRLTALVVADSERSQGVGKRLLESAEAVFLEWGCARAELSSGESRADAHRFYLREAYAEAPKRFLKILDASR